MITGPSVGPAMFLTVLMRWPALIVVGAIVGTGAIAYKAFDGEQILAEYLHPYIEKPVQRLADSAEKEKTVDHLAVAKDPAPPSASASSSTIEPAEPVKAIEPTAPKPTTAKIEKEPENERYAVRSGDSLSAIVLHRVSAAQSKKLMAAIFEQNKHAFVDDDQNQLRADVIITIPRKY